MVDVPDMEPVLESVLPVAVCAKSAVADSSDIPKAAIRIFFIGRTLLAFIGSTEVLLRDMVSHRTMEYSVRG